MSLEVFFCSTPLSPERTEIAAKMLAWWETQPVKIRMLTPKILGCDPYSFQKLRRAAADVMAKNEYYVLTDDDISLVSGSVEEGIEALRSNPQFAILSAWPANANICRWTPENYEVYESLDTMEHYSVGGMRFCRRSSMIKGWPEQVGAGYDTEHCQRLRECGYRVGYLQHVRAHHWGENRSDIWGKR